MASRSHTTKARSLDGEQPLHTIATGWLSMVLDFQQAQLGALIGFQQALQSIGQEVWDEWRCRYAGGAPFDV